MEREILKKRVVEMNLDNSIFDLDNVFEGYF